VTEMQARWLENTGQSIAYLQQRLDAVGAEHAHVCDRIVVLDRAGSLGLWLASHREAEFQDAGLELAWLGQCASARIPGSRVVQASTCEARRGTQQLTTSRWSRC
jgi:hypothetical protein